MSGILVDEEETQVLLVRRRIDPFKGYWDIPGGFVDMGESMEDGLRRELKEELAVDVSIKRFLGTYPDTYGPDATPVIAVFYVATVAAGSPSPGSDVSECRWFPREETPPDLAFANGRWALEQWRDERGQGRRHGRTGSPPRGIR